LAFAATNFTTNPQLATWVKCQRRQYKLFCQGRASNMTQERIVMLEEIGFEWALREYKVRELSECGSSTGSNNNGKGSPAPANASAASASMKASVD